MRKKKFRCCPSCKKLKDSADFGFRMRFCLVCNKPNASVSPIKPPQDHRDLQKRKAADFERNMLLKEKSNDYVLGQIKKSLTRESKEKKRAAFGEAQKKGLKLCWANFLQTKMVNRTAA